MRQEDPDCPLDGRKLEPSSGLYQPITYLCAGCGARYTSLEHNKLRQEAVSYLRSLQTNVETRRSELAQKESSLERIIAHAKVRGLIE